MNIKKNTKFNRPILTTVIISFISGVLLSYIYYSEIRLIRIFPAEPAAFWDNIPIVIISCVVGAYLGKTIRSKIKLAVLAFFSIYATILTLFVIVFYDTISSF